MTDTGKTTTNILDMIKTTVDEKQRWTSGESVTLHKSKNFRVSITEGGRDGGGVLFLIGTVGEWPKHRQVTGRCGIFGLGGWMLTMGTHSYGVWAKDCKRALGLPLDNGGRNGA